MEKDKVVTVISDHYALKTYEVGFSLRNVVSNKKCRSMNNIQKLAKCTKSSDTSSPRIKPAIRELRYQIQHSAWEKVKS
jgi:hypothetical protein